MSGKNDNIKIWEKAFDLEILWMIESDHVG